MKCIQHAATNKDKQCKQIILIRSCSNRSKLLEKKLENASWQN